MRSLDHGSHHPDASKGCRTRLEGRTAFRPTELQLPSSWGVQHPGLKCKYLAPLWVADSQKVPSGYGLQTATSYKWKSSTKERTISRMGLSDGGPASGPKTTQSPRNGIAMLAPRIQIKHVAYVAVVYMPKTCPPLKPVNSRTPT